MLYYLKITFFSENMEKDIANFSIKYLQEKETEYAEARLEEYDNTGFIV